MNEAEMAKALEGKFFWERTTKYENSVPRGTTEIRHAQKMFRPKAVNQHKHIPPKEWWISRLPPEDFDQQVAHLRTGVSIALGVKEKDIFSRSTKLEFAFAKRFFGWCLYRYFNVSAVQMAKAVGRHHSTLIHARDGFEREKNNHLDLVAQMDKYMGYTPG